MPNTDLTNEMIDVRVDQGGVVPCDVVAACAEPSLIWSEPNPFLEPWFLGPALRHLREARDVRLVHIWSAGQLIGLIPISINKPYGRIPISYTGNWQHYQSFMGTPLIRAGYESAFWNVLIETLDNADWAPAFLSLSGISEGGNVHQGLAKVAQTLNRPCAIVHRHERAILHSELSAEDYLETTLRGKKRKEIRRLSNRLADTGAVAFRVFSDGDSLKSWCDEFLALEAAGWKGKDGAALANTSATRAFFDEIIKGAFHANRLEIQRLDLDGRAIAMLINFRTPPGSWQFKIAYDEALARFSPGVLIELENLPRVLADPEIDWMDSCAVENHPMINSLWRERRSIVQVTVPLAGARRRLIHTLCRTAESSSAGLRNIIKKGSN